MLVRLNVACLVLCCVCLSAHAASPIAFEKHKLSDAPYEAACAADLDNDGDLDIVCGEYWYEGPDFATKHKMCDVLAASGYHDDFGVYPMDVDGDGWTDIVSGGWFGKSLTWRQNPDGKPVEWTVHKIAEVGNIERPCFWDVDGDGDIEVVPNLPGGPLLVFKLVRNASGKGAGTFERYEISSKPQGHGLGFGDINGDGKGDFVLSSGWYEAPAKPLQGEWKWHPEFSYSSPGVPILVYDVSGDGRNDLILGSGHNYGLFWARQDDDGKWTQHDLDTKGAQYHELRLADLDNDGTPELITGKRYHAHNGNDPGAEDPLGLYYYTLLDGKPAKVTIDYGPPATASGAGIYMWIADLDGNGFNDIIAPGKEGLYLFWNRGPAAGDGFTPLFNGKDLSGWRGDPKLWSVRDGVIVGSTEGNPLKHNSFLATEKEYGDFVLRVSVKLRNHNSGIQIRSKQRDDYVVTGHQADIATSTYFGMLYREQAGGIMPYWNALSPQERAAVHASAKQGDWNQYVITCKGSSVKMVLNGNTVCDVVDPEIPPKGVIAFQVHVGEPMEVYFKDISISQLKPD